jgi:hypothetical protein
MRFSTIVQGILTIIAATALQIRPAAAGPTEATPFAWVQMVQGGPEARAITSLPHCPILTVDGRPQPMSPRGSPDAAFPMTVCQLKLSPAARRILLGGASLPLPVANPQRILIFGDSGCRVKETVIQACNNPRLWPFAQVVRHAATHHPDLVIHVGDYYYREGPCPAGERGCAGSPFGDVWSSWRAEFFGPAQPLLAEAPWVFVRGNHEACGRGARGWFHLLDAGPAPLACPAVSASFKVDLGDLDLYVVDSANTYDRDHQAPMVARFSAQLNAFGADMTHGRGWIVTHRPFWGLTPFARLGPIGPFEAPINQTEQAAVAGRDLRGVQLVVSGHIHQFTALDFGPARPAQLIAGTGGDIGEDADVARIRTDQVRIDGMDADRLTFDRFGYFLLDRTGVDWVGTFRDIDDRVVATCRLHERRLQCSPAKGG